jgi:hypothetical protein
MRPMGRFTTVVAHAIPRSYGIEILVPSYETNRRLEGRTAKRYVDGEVFEFGWSPIIKQVSCDDTPLLTMMRTDLLFRKWS